MKVNIKKKTFAASNASFVCLRSKVHLLFSGEQASPSTFSFLATGSKAIVLLELAMSAYGPKQASAIAPHISACDPDRTCVSSSVKTVVDLGLNGEYRPELRALI